MNLVIFAAAAPPPADPMTPLYALVGSLVILQLVGMGFAFVRWMGSRTVEREDKDKEKLEAEVRSLREEHDTRLGKMEQSFSALDRAIVLIQAEGKQILSVVDGIRGAVAEVKAGLDNRFEKQSDFYRSQLKEMLEQVTEKLEKLEFDLRQETTRAMRDASELGGNKKRRR